MIIPTMKIFRLAFTGEHDINGQPIFRPQVAEMVSPVKVRFSNQNTTVRTDTAASHGHAYETVADVIVLALPTSKIALEDVLIIRGYRVKVAETHPRFTAVAGKLDHIEVRCLAAK
jgi:hypothetical protein